MITLSWDTELHVTRLTKPFSQVGPKDVIVLKNGDLGYVEWITESADHLGDRAMSVKFLNVDQEDNGVSCYNGITDMNVLRVWDEKVLFVIDANHPYVGRCDTFRKFYDTVIAPKLPPELRR